MSHAFVFEVSNEVERRTSDLPDHCYGSICDYYMALEPDVRKKAIAMLGNSIQQIVKINPETSEMKAEFTPEAIQDYFESDYLEFMKWLSTLQKEATREAFAGDNVSRLAWALNMLRDTFYGDCTYIFDTDQEELNTLEWWLRGLEPGDQFYVGTVWDYHF